MARFKTAPIYLFVVYFSQYSLHAGGYTIHHASPTIMCIRLPNRKLYTTDADNASVFVPRFDSFFNNHRPINWPVIDEINQIDFMEELYPSYSCYEIKKFIPKLANDKSPILNSVPPNSFESLNE